MLLKTETILSVERLLEAIKDAYPDVEKMLWRYYLADSISFDNRHFEPKINIIISAYETRAALGKPNDEHGLFREKLFERIMPQINTAFICPFIKNNESIIERVVLTIEIVKELATYFGVKAVNLEGSFFNGLIDTNEKSR